MAENKNITQTIERIEAFEDRAGVVLKNLYARFEPNWRPNPQVIVNGEIHLRDGADVKENVVVVASAHDASGRVLDIDHARFQTRKMVVFEAFSMCLYRLLEEPVKLRIYPKP